MHILTNYTRLVNTSILISSLDSSFLQNYLWCWLIYVLHAIDPFSVNVTLLVFLSFWFLTSWSFYPSHFYPPDHFILLISNLLITLYFWCLTLLITHPFDVQVCPPDHFILFIPLFYTFYPVEVYLSRPLLWLSIWRILVSSIPLCLWW